MKTMLEGSGMPAADGDAALERLDAAEPGELTQVTDGIAVATAASTHSHSLYAAAYFWLRRRKSSLRRGLLMMSRLAMSLS